MAAVARSTLVLYVRQRGHMENLTHITDVEAAGALDGAYRRLRAKLDAARGQEVEKKEAYAHVAPGVRFIVLPEDFYQLRGLLFQKTTSVEIQH